MALGEAINAVGTWQASMAVSADGAWRGICVNAANTTRCPTARHAWRVLAAQQRADVAARLNASGIHI